MMLDHTTDNYNGVTIESAGLPWGNKEFKEALETSLEAWKLTGKKGVWLKVTTPCGLAAILCVQLIVVDVFLQKI